jgi:hypothetical protein
MSEWAQTRTMFPLFVDALRQRPSITSVIVVGAADGKFVLPLLDAGFEIVAVESDEAALNGTSGKYGAYEKGLRRQAAASGLSARLTIVAADWLDISTAYSAGAVWTSCSWHYSANHRRPLAEFVRAMRDATEGDALFGAEFMMPVNIAHVSCEHYTHPAVVASVLAGWHILWSLESDIFVEEPHLGSVKPHVHRMGLVIACKTV